MLKHCLLAAAAVGALAAFPAAAQDHSGHTMPMPENAPAPSPTPAPMPMPMDHSMHGGDAAAPDAPPGPAIADYKPGNCSVHDAYFNAGGEGGDEAIVGGVRFICRSTAGSGTSRLPAAEGAMTGLHIMTGNQQGDWMFMVHGSATLAFTGQSGPRGDDQLYVPSMAMVSADRDISHFGHLQLRGMFSLDPLMGARGYPNLFATGETANGVSLVDRQHPHDLFMELSARFDLAIGGDNTLYLYGGPVAEPALGPSAFMHRRSARYLPLAPISHHWFDSTHITYGVVTAGFANPLFRIEASVFRGREPDEERWDIETPSLDSWSVRATITPDTHWTAQVSHGRLREPEATHPGVDEARTTASIHYADSRFTAMLAFSSKDRLPGPALNAWIAEANWNLAGPHNLFGRVENVANDELFADHNHPMHDRVFRITRFEGGYAYRIPLGGQMNLALGGSVMAFAKPAALDPYYGNPFGYTLFARLSLGD